MAVFDLKEIFRNTFGYEAPPAFQINNAPSRLESTQKGQQLYATDVWGREFFLPVFLDELLIPFAVMSMNWKKNVVSTHMPERGGSIHEQISMDDYTFNIKGLAVDENGKFPEADIIQLHTLFKKDTSVRLRSALSAIVLNDGNEQVVIKEINWPASAGIEHVKAFEIDCVSDMVFELILK